MTDAGAIRTDRLVLRPLRLDDAAGLHAIYGDEQAMRWWSHAAHATVDQTESRLRDNLAQSDWTMWAITRDDLVIGTLAAYAKRQGGVIEIGYALAQDHWGQGYAREAVVAWIDRWFAMGIRRIVADTDADNIASNRLLEALGFTLEGRLRGEWETHIGVRDSLIWGLLAAEWRPVPPPG